MKTLKLCPWTVVAILLLSILFTGCKSKKSLVTPSEVDLTRNVAEQVLSAEPHFKTMHLSKMTMSVVSERYNFNFRTSVKVVTDSIISISILPMMGIEMVRVDFTPTNFTIVDKMNKKYAVGTYDYFKSKFGIVLDYHSIQGLLSNCLFTIPTTQGEMADKFITEREGLQIKLCAKEKVMNLVLSFLIDNNGRIESCRLGDNNSSMMSVSYGELTRFNEILFPTVVSADFVGTKQRINATFAIERVAFNNDLVVAPLDLSRYVKSTVTNILP